jgi:hypothetical protein
MTNGFAEGKRIEETRAFPLDSLLEAAKNECQIQDAKFKTTGMPREFA